MCHNKFLPGKLPVSDLTSEEHATTHDIPRHRAGEICVALIAY